MPKLTALGVAKQVTPGKYRDENGLILQITQNKAGGLKKSWLVRYSIGQRQREMGIGAFPELGLAEARIEAMTIRLKAKQGVDPIRERQSEQDAVKQAQKWMNFEDCALRFIETHERAWSNPKHRQQWRNSLATYVYPKIGKMNVADIGVAEVMEILEPIWYTKTETASRIRGRIESVNSWATVRGYRSAPNPAIWRGHLEMLLPKRSKVRRVRHHRALEWERLPAFFNQLGDRTGVSARALEFTILTASRSGEVRHALWSEIDWVNRIWIITAERMKMRREHRVPLTAQCLDLLRGVGDGDARYDRSYIFTTRADPSPMSNAVYRALYTRMGVEGITTHGFRSSFRDWAGVVTHHPREVAEMALAHNVGDATERAYRRSDALEKRRLLMQDWSDYCCSKR